MTDLTTDLIGENVLIRTVTHYHIGRLTAFDDTMLKLEDACWLTDTGRFGECLATGQVMEAEPFCDPVHVSRGAVVDVTIWRHALIRAAIA